MNFPLQVYSQENDGRLRGRRGALSVVSIHFIIQFAEFLARELQNVFHLDVLPDTIMIVCNSKLVVLAIK